MDSVNRPVEQQASAGLDASHMSAPTDHGSVYDVIVIGSGAAGMSAAIATRLEGLSVLVVEKHDRIGGSTARSGGNMWIPCNRLAREKNIEDSAKEALAYVKAEAGDMFEPERVEAYLRTGPEMLETYGAQTSAMEFVLGDGVADNHPDLPGAKDNGRTVTVPPFDARKLGKYRKLLAGPLPELTFLGMQIQPGAELNKFFTALKSPASLTFVCKRLMTQLRDKLLYGQTVRLANGNALAARLLKSALDLGVEFRTKSMTGELITRDDEVVGTVLETPAGQERVHARRGVLLACGGFPHDRKRREHLSPVGVHGAGRYALGPQTNTGEGLSLAEAAGGVVEDRLPNTVSWTPVSRIRRSDGSYGLFPHAFDRFKPGYVFVARNGRRFASEGAVGNDQIRALVGQCGDTVNAEAFLIADHRALTRYGLGMVRPWPVPFRAHLRSGYLIRRSTIGELADALGIDRQLEETICRYNQHALVGRDSEFGRGESDLEKRNASATEWPNACLAPIDRGPFYAIRIYPGDFSTLAGVRVDECARVLRVDGSPVPRLYAAGNDACSMFGGNSIAGGATLGPAMTFGYIAAKDLARASDAFEERT